MMKMKRIFIAVIICVCCWCPLYLWAANRGPINSGETKNETINAQGQIDSWTFEGQAGDRILIDAESLTPGLDTEIILVDPDDDNEIFM